MSTPVTVSRERSMHRSNRRPPTSQGREDVQMILVKRSVAIPDDDLSDQRAQRNAQDVECVGALHPSRLKAEFET
jgi:hypothetical protein